MIGEVIPQLVDVLACITEVRQQVEASWSLHLSHFALYLVEGVSDIKNIGEVIEGSRLQSAV